MTDIDLTDVAWTPIASTAGTPKIKIKKEKIENIKKLLLSDKKIKAIKN